MHQNKRKGISIFEKYNIYSKDIIQLSIDTLLPEEKLLLKKKYGDHYLGTGYILNKEEIKCENVEKNFLQRLKKVEELLKENMTNQQILDHFKKQSSIFNLYSNYSKQMAGNNLKDSFIENFPVQYQTIIYKILSQITEEEKELISTFYWGHNYDILKKDIDKDKINDLRILINKLKDEAIKIFQHKDKASLQQNKKEKKDIKKNNVDTNFSSKQIKTKKLCEEKDREKVLEIVNKFKETNPNYYEVITKKYSGDNFEISNNVKLTKEEQILIHTAKVRIKELMHDSKKLYQFLNDCQNGFLDIYKEDDQVKVLKIVNKFKERNPNYYEIITKIYNGDRLEIRNKDKLTPEEQFVIRSIRIKILNLLKDSKKLNNFLNFQGAFLEKYEEEDKVKALKIVNKFKETNPNYYEVITKKYSGDNFEISNNVKLTKEEQILIHTAKVRVKELMHDSKKLYQFLNDCQNGFLEKYKEEDCEKILEIVNKFKETNPSYYKVITKKYSGDKLEISNNVKLTKEEQILINNAKIKIKRLLEDSTKLNNFLNSQSGFLEKYKGKERERLIKIVNKFKETDPNYYEVITKKYSGDKLEISNNVTLTREEKSLINNAKIKIKKLLDNMFFDINEKNINIYINNLDKYSNDISIQIIKAIARQYPNRIIDVMNSQYMQEKFKYLTQKEQIYIYLNLLSYSIPSLTKDKISQILNIEKLFLEEYQVMTLDANVNELNKLIKK